MFETYLMIYLTPHIILKRKWKIKIHKITNLLHSLLQ